MIFSGLRRRRAKKKVFRVCKALSCLLELNKEYRIDSNYTHCVRALKTVLNEDEYNRATKESMLLFAKECSAASVEKKKRNDALWNEYYEKVQAVLLDNPFLASEAKAAGLSEREYGELASESLLESTISSDSQPLECVIEVAVLGRVNFRKTFEYSFTEISGGTPSDVENIGEGLSYSTSENDEDAVATAVTLSAEVEGVPPATVETKAPLEEAPDSVGPTQPETDPVAVAPSPEEEDISSLDESEDNEENESLSNSEALRALYAKDKVIGEIHNLYKKDSSIIGIIARELVSAKGLD